MMKMTRMMGTKHEGASRETQQAHEQHSMKKNGTATRTFTEMKV